MDVAARDPDVLSKGYDLNFTKDDVPMHVFSESSQGKLNVEGKVEYKFDMKPTTLGDEDYRKLCRERLTKSMVKTRTVQAFLKEVLLELCSYNKRAANQGIWELRPEYRRTVAADETATDTKDVKN